MGIEERTQQRVIDGVLYEVTPLPFAIGNSALLRFMKLASPVIGKILASKGEGATMESAAAAALMIAPQVLEEDDIKYFAREFGKASKYDDGNGKMVPMLEAAQEVHFACRYSAFFEWLAFCVEVNFSGFFGDLIKRVGSAGPQAAANAR